jgi:hypothetical protein
MEAGHDHLGQGVGCTSTTLLLTASIAEKDLRPRNESIPRYILRSETPSFLGAFDGFEAPPHYASRGTCVLG